LVETALSVALFVFIMGSLLVLIQMTSKGLVRAKERIKGERLSQMGLSRLKNIPFYDLMPPINSAGSFVVNPLDSDLDAFGFLPGESFGRPGGIVYASYPSLNVLQDYKDYIFEHGFDRFTVDIVFWRRDTTVAGKPLVLFYPDGNNPPTDQGNAGLGIGPDPNLMYFDENGDGDFNDVYVSNAGYPYTNQNQSEVPSTNLREIILKLYKKGRKVTEHSSMVSLGQFSGAGGISAASHLNLNITTPTQHGFLFRHTTPAQNYAMYTVTLSSDYPASYVTTPLNDNELLTVAGTTEGTATVYFSEMGNPSHFTSVDAVAGTFSTTLSIAFTGGVNGFVEGENAFVAYALSGGASRSPYVIHRLLLDMAPPVITDALPVQGATIRDKTPVVRARLRDLPAGTTTNISGLYTGVTYLAYSYNGATPSSVTYTFDPLSGYVTWIDANGMPRELPDGNYEMTLEGGDHAKYKVSFTWDFDISVIPGDGDGPVFGACESPNTWTIRIHVSDPDTGIKPNSIVLKVDTVTKINLNNIAGKYDQSTGYVTFISDTNLDLGSPHNYVVETTVENWATSGNGFGPQPPNICNITIP